MSGRLVLVRHGQSEANVAKRLDTRPPGAELTQLGRQQARDFGIDWAHPVGLVVHSVAARAQLRLVRELLGGRALGLEALQRTAALLELHLGFFECMRHL